MAEGQELRVGSVWHDRYRLPDRYVRVACIEKFVMAVYVQVRVCHEDGTIDGRQMRMQPIIAAQLPKRYDLHRDFINGALTEPIPRKPVASYGPARARRETPAAGEAPALSRVRPDPV